MARGFRKFLLSVGLIGFLLAGGVMIAGWLYSTKPPPVRTAEPPLPPLVKVRTMVPEDIQEYFIGYGTARAKVDAVLAAEVRGVVVQIAEGLDDGVHVEAGQLLARIDDRQYRQHVSRTEAMMAELEAQIVQLDVEEANIARLMAISEQEVEVNRNELHRVAGLFEKQQAAKKEYDFARLAYQQSRRQHVAYQNQLDLIAPRRTAFQASLKARRADAELAALDVERCRITAPFAGEVESVSVDMGDHLHVGGEILRLLSIRVVEIPIQLAASVRWMVAVGARCRLEADSMPGVYWNGVVARIAPSADAQSRTFAAYVEADNDRQLTPLVPGTFVTARVEGPLRKQVLAVPRGVVLESHVFVVNDNRVHVRPVQVDRYVGDLALVTGELKPGDDVVLTNLDVLSEGSVVRVARVPSGSDRTAPEGGNVITRRPEMSTPGGDR